MSDKKTDNDSPPEDTASNAGVQIGRVEGEQVNIGDITGRDKTTVSDVQDAAVATGGSAAATRGGIAISGNVGRDLVISVGNTELSLPLTLQVTIGFIIMAVTVLIGLVSYNTSIALAPTPTLTPTLIPPMDETGFNIAVAEFALAGEAATQPDLAKAGLDVGNWLAGGIKDEKVLYPTIHATVREPDKVGLIPGEDREIRAVNAARYADDNNVNILIYGIITGSHSGYFVEPEFYVSWRGFDYGSEVAGPGQLGRQVSIQLPFENPDKNDLNNELKIRRRVLHHVVYGLGYFYYNKNIEAFDEFDDASSETAGEGLEVVHLLKGAAKLMASDYLKADPIKRAEFLNEAANAFSQAITLNPNYARSYLGLGAVALQQATIYNMDGTDIAQVVPTRLIEAKDWYTASLSAGDQPPLPYVLVKANFGLGQIHLVGYEFTQPNWSGTEARSFLNQVVDAYNAEPTAELIWFAGEAQALLCRLNEIDKKWAKMSSECQKAIETLRDVQPESKRIKISIAHYYVRAACAEKKQKHFDQAREFYNKAIDAGRGYVSAEELARWQTAHDQVEEGDSCHGI